MNYESFFETYKETTVTGKYVALHHIKPIFLKLKERRKVSVIGKSVSDNPIYVYKNGSGPYRIMMWSQMHGNESTTTKAVLDLFNYLDSEKGKELKQKFTFCIIPMLNPDGAKEWTRNNANNIDLNRDSYRLSQPESQVLRQCIEEFKPDLCFNLHDQRTIFGVEGTYNPATISFLAPSYNLEKEINDVRKKAMEVIVSVNEDLQKYIPNQIGRFDDTFNIDCIGDTVQNLGIPTILIEAGYYPDDYQREITRKYVFIGLLSALCNFKRKEVIGEKYLEYFNIPNNLIFFFDFIYKNVKLNYENKQIITNFAAQFSERVDDEKILFEARVEKIGDLSEFRGHFEFDGRGEEYSNGAVGDFLTINQKADFKIGDIVFKNGFPINNKKRV